MVRTAQFWGPPEPRDYNLMNVSECKFSNLIIRIPSGLFRYRLGHIGSLLATVNGLLLAQDYGLKTKGRE